MPDPYEVLLVPEAREGFERLDKTEQQLVYKQLRKLERAPELGAVLSGPLAGYRKLYAARKRIRIIYCIENGQLIVTVIAVGPREHSQVYAVATDVAAKRRLRRIS